MIRSENLLLEKLLDRNNAFLRATLAQYKSLFIEIVDIPRLYVVFGDIMLQLFENGLVGHNKCVLRKTNKELSTYRSKVMLKML